MIIFSFIPHNNAEFFWLIQVVDDGEVEPKDVGPVEWVSYWKPNVTINLVDDMTK